MVTTISIGSYDGDLGEVARKFNQDMEEWNCHIGNYRQYGVWDESTLPYLAVMTQSRREPGSNTYNVMLSISSDHENKNGVLTRRALSQTGIAWKDVSNQDDRHQGLVKKIDNTFAKIKKNPVMHIRAFRKKSN